MHHFESNGFGFNYNGDYSGDIHIEDANGHTQTREFSDLITIAVRGVGFEDSKRNAIRDFVGEAVRMATISSVEQMSTDELLDDFSAHRLFGLPRTN